MSLDHKSLFEHWWNIRNVYRRFFQQGARDAPTVESLLGDLREFCRADGSCVVVGKDGHIDIQATFVAEGRREVWLKIEQTLNLSDQSLMKIKEQEDV